MAIAVNARARALVCSALLCAIAFGDQPRALAQSQAPRSQAQRWLVVPSTSGQTGNPGHAARRGAKILVSELEARGRLVLQPEEAKRLFEQRGSSPPIAINASDVDGLARDAQQALYHIASGLHARAEEDVQRAMQRAGKALESLNRETRAARHLLDACMFLVRGHLEHRDREKARRQALECRRLVPDIDPDTTMHPPNVIGVLAEAEAELLSRDPSSLRIESEPQGCAVLVNGRNLGTTPKELARLSSGEYRVQVECNDGEPGRVHRAVLSGNRAVVRVDTKLDRVVQTAFDLSLRYESMPQERSRRVHDGLEAARIVGASELVLVSLTDEADESAPVVVAERFRVDDGAPMAKAFVTLGAKGAADELALRTAVFVLIEAQAPPPTHVAQASRGSNAVADAQAPRVIEAEERDPRASSDAERALSEPVAASVDRGESASTWTIIGLSSAGVGLAASLAAWGLLARHSALQTDYTVAHDVRSPDRFEAYRQVSDFDAVPSIALGAGSVLLSASLPLWLPEHAGVPWWAWGSGAVGTLGAAVGLKLAIDAGECTVDEFGRCTSPVLATRVGTLLLLQAVPFLALPVTYGVRALTGGEVEAKVAIGQGGAQLTFEGRL